MFVLFHQDVDGLHGDIINKVSDEIEPGMSPRGTPRRSAKKTSIPDFEVFISLDVFKS
jgi:hypothetical protein